MVQGLSRDVELTAGLRQRAEHVGLGAGGRLDEAAAHLREAARRERRND